MPEKHDQGFLTVSNLLSLSRIPLGVMFLVTNDPKALALIVFAGSLTDLLDGVIARISGTISEVGILLDPFCDKIFVLLGVVSFLPSGRLDWAGFVKIPLGDRLVAYAERMHARPAYQSAAALNYSILPDGRPAGAPAR